jgi:hypothetical protein
VGYFLVVLKAGPASDEEPQMLNSFLRFMTPAPSSWFLP